MAKRHIRNSYVREQIMRMRIKCILARNARIKKGYLPRPDWYFDLSEHFSTTTQSTGSLTLQDLRQTVTSLLPEMRAAEQQSLYESYFRPEIIRAPWRMMGVHV